MKKQSLKKMFESNIGSIVISIILGLGLAAIFRRVCTEGNCIVIQGPDVQEVQKYFYKINDQCYKYSPVFSECA